MWWKEAIGIVATLLVLTSFICVKIHWIRAVNMIGSAVFVVYGILIGALSIWLLNGIMIFVNGYQLFKLHKVKTIDRRHSDESKSMDA